LLVGGHATVDGCTYCLRRWWRLFHVDTLI
jgi:hypothetical protein